MQANQPYSKNLQDAIAAFRALPPKIAQRLQQLAALHRKKHALTGQSEAQIKADEVKKASETYRVDTPPE